MKSGYSLGLDGIPSITKAPLAELDYPVDWLDWLTAVELISAVVSVVVAPSGLTIISQAPSADSKSVLVWLGGGTLGATYRVSVTITTNAGRTDTRSFDVKVVTR